MNRQQMEAHKRALVAESEAYRETLRLDLAQLQLHATQLRRRFQLVALVPTALALLPVLMRLFRPGQPQGKPKAGVAGFLSAALAGWRLARRFGPVVSSLRRHARRNGFRPRHQRSATEE